MRALSMIILAAFVFAGAGSANSATDPAIDVHDHTLVIQAVIENTAAIRAQLGQTPKLGSEEEGRLILKFLLTLPNVSSDTKAIIVRALNSPKPPPQSEGCKTLSKQLEAGLNRSFRNVEQLGDAVSQMVLAQSSCKVAIKRLDDGIALLTDGQSTIYNPSWVGANGGGPRQTAGLPLWAQADIAALEKNGIWAAIFVSAVVAIFT